MFEDGQMLMALHDAKFINAGEKVYVFTDGEQCLRFESGEEIPTVYFDFSNFIELWFDSVGQSN